MGHKHSVRDTGAHFTIDQYTRQIKNDSANKTTIVQYDHNSEKLTFEIPLYIDGHAMTLCDLIEIHFINISTDGQNQTPGIYEVNDIKADGDKAIFTWLISQEATQLAGSLSFFIVFKCTENGVTVYRWGTEICKTLAISAGMDNGEAVLTEYPDVLAQWKAQIFGASDNAVLAVETAEANALAAIEAAGEAKKQTVLDSIPDEYEALSALADSNYRNKAGAIVLDAEGENIAVNDASEYPLQNLKMFGKSEHFKTTGKNLLEVTQTGGSVSTATVFVNDDGSLVLNGTVSVNSAFIIGKFRHDGEFILSLESVGNTNGSYVYLDMSPDDNISWYGKDITFTNDGTERTLLAVIIAGTYSNVTFYPMIRYSSITDGAYEPYTGGVASPSPEWAQEINSVGNAVVNVCGKNFFNGELGGGIYLSNSFALDTSNPDIYKSTRLHLMPGVYTVSFGKPVNIVREILDGFYSVVNGVMGVTEYTFEVRKYGEVGFTFRDTTSAETAWDDTTAIQIEVGREATEYEPYKELQTVTIPRTLPGIPVSSGGNYTDENGQTWICDEVDLARGVYVQRIDVANMQNCSIADYALSGTTGRGQLIVAPKNPKDRAKYGTICNIAKINYDALGAVDGEYYENPANIVFVGAVGETAEEIKTKYADFEYLYILETPIETALSNAEINAFKALHSNKPNTTILNDAGAYMAVEYVADTKTYIDNKIKEMMEGSD